jgi:hypothetical protein
MERLMHADRPEAAGRHRTVAIIAAALAAYDRAGRQAPIPSSGLSAWRRALRPGGRSR